MSLIMLMSVSVVHSIALGGEMEITPFNACVHNYSIHISTNETTRKHKYECSKCGATQEEPCYVSDNCSTYYNIPYPTCDLCHITVFDVHDFQYTFTGTSLNPTHQLMCVAMDGYSSCMCTLGGHEPCTYTNILIYRSYSSKGHRLVKECDDCGNKISLGYYDPEWHTSGSDPNCDYCGMDTAIGIFDTDDLLSLGYEII